MAAYNTVEVPRLIRCPRCGNEGLINVQFAYGDTAQYNFKLGDVVRWGGNDVGVRSERTEIIAFPESCPVCGLDIDGEYVLEISEGLFTGVRLATPNDVTRLEAE